MEKFKIGLELRVMMFVCFAFEVDSHLHASSVFLKGVYNLATILVLQFTQNSTLTAVAAKRRQPVGTVANTSGNRFAKPSPGS